MSPRPKKDAAPAKAEPKKGKAAAPEATSKGAKGAKATTAAKAAKGKKNEPSDQIPVIEGQAVDPDELEEAEDEAAAARSGGGSSNDAALAAAGGAGEMSASFKNFRHHPDMENFYRFIYENDLRHEALAIIDEIMVEKRKKKALKGGKAAH